MSKLGIIIATYGSESQRYLDHCLLSVSRSLCDISQIVLISSGEYKPTATINMIGFEHVHSDQRLHFPAAVAKGYEHLKKDIDTICLLNDDIILQKHTLNRMKFMVENNERILINPMSNCDNGKTFLMNFDKFSNRQYKIDDINQADVDSIINLNIPFPRGVILTSFIAFYCTMMTRAAYEDIGGIDPHYKTGQDDLDLCLRASKKDYTMGIATDTFCFHFSGATADRVLTQKDRQFNVEYFKSKWGDEVRFDPMKAGNR